MLWPPGGSREVEGSTLTFTFLDVEIDSEASVTRGKAGGTEKLACSLGEPLVVLKPEL